MHPLEIHIVGTVTAFVFGLLFGSFATMASYRIPRKEELVLTPSHCPKCFHRLGFFDLFPVLSWLFNRRKCRYCKTDIHWRYPATELLMASLFAIFYWHTGLTLQCLSLLLMSVCLVIIIIIQVENNLIPNSMLVPLVPSALLYKYSINSPIYEYFIATIIAFFTMLLLNPLFKKINNNPFVSKELVGLYLIASLFISTNNIIAFAVLFTTFNLLNGYLFIFFRKNYNISMTFSLVVSLILCVLLK